MENTYHIPALLQPTIDGLNIQRDGIYVDVTCGGGGHSRAILEAMGTPSEQDTPPQKRLYSFDKDIDALTHQQQSSPSLMDDPRWQFVHSDFRYLRNFMHFYGVTRVNGILADLGVSFHHFDEAERGFSFRFSGPLDMRMNQRGGRTAADIVNSYTEESLAHVLYTYGELRNSRQLAARIVKSRSQEPIRTTEQLVDIIGEDKKVLTLVFQALRIEVNDELASLRELLLAGKDLLGQGGRFAILTYHSLEDRMVKNFFRSGNLQGEIQKDFYGNIDTPFTLIEKGRCATEEEVARNPRSRSAKLRIAEKVCE